jgi:uncharacterized protein (TIGR02466 family)
MQAVLRLRGLSSSNPNPGCAWTGDLNGVWQLHRLAAFAGLVQQLQAQVWLYIDRLGFEISLLAAHIQRSWPVVSEPGQLVGRHHHPNAHISAVFYLNGDGSGEQGSLRLFAPRQLNELVPGLAVGHGGPLRKKTSDAATEWISPWLDVAPQAGLLVIFPAVLDHAVTENVSSDERRLSIAFDVALTAVPAQANDPAPPEYLAPHPSQWDALRQDGQMCQEP